MPIWLSFIFWKIVLPDFILWLHNSGHINAAAELAAKGALELARDVKAIKTYPEYPSGKNGT